MSVGELIENPVALLNASPAGGEYAQNAILETLRTMNWRIVEDACRVQPFVKRRITGAVEDEETLNALRALSSMECGGNASAF